MSHYLEQPQSFTSVLLERAAISHIYFSTPVLPRDSEYIAYLLRRIPLTVFIRVVALN